LSRGEIAAKAGDACRGGATVGNVPSAGRIGLARGLCGVGSTAGEGARTNGGGSAGENVGVPCALAVEAATSLVLQGADVWWGAAALTNCIVPVAELAGAAVGRV
jgi:hypothetical protein